jgi:hypothetical protein
MNTSGFKRPSRSDSQPDSKAEMTNATKVIEDIRAIVRLAALCVRPI